MVFSQIMVNICEIELRDEDCAVWLCFGLAENDIYDTFPRDKTPQQ